MAMRSILEWPNPILETRAQHVTNFGESLQSLIKDMLDTMEAAQGIGLAANQVGELKRVIVIRIGSIPTEDGEYKQNPALRNAPYAWENKTYILINPQITQKEGRIRYDEGCLSFPELYEEIERARRVWLTYQDENGTECSLVAEDLFAICIQHEIDHLDGVVFVNRLKGRECQRAKKRFQTIKEKRLAQSSENIALNSGG